MSKTRHIKINAKLGDLKEAKKMSTERLIADLRNKYSILNGAKHFSSNRLQSCLVFQLQTQFISNISNKIESLRYIGVTQESIKNLHILQILLYFQSWLTGIVDFLEWNLKESVYKTVRFSFIKKWLIYIFHIN